MRRRLPKALRRREPWIVLIPLVLAQWGAVLAFALTVRHNGWLYYQGGDQLWHYTSAWLLTRGELTVTEVGFGWPIVLAPIAAVAGASLLSALPAIVVFNVVVLLPLAVLGLYGLGARLGGRPVGYAAAAFWVAAPWAAIPLFIQRYHEKYVEQFLPQAVGLTAMSDLPSTVALIVAAGLVVQTIDSGDTRVGVAAGLALGVVLAIKPSAALVLPAVFLALVLARRGHGLVGVGAGLMLPLVALTVWKFRGLGVIPAFESQSIRLAAGTTEAVPNLLSPIERYFIFEPERYHRLYLDLREVFWSVRLLQWIPVAGAIALARRSVAASVLVGGWFLAILVVKGGSEQSTIDSGSFFRLVMPAFPALCVFAGALLLLVPGIGGRLARSRVIPAKIGTPLLVAIGGVLALATALFFVARPLSTPEVARYPRHAPPIPILDDLDVSVERTADGATVSWNPASPASAGVFYQVYRGRQGEIDCAVAEGAADCPLGMEPVGATHETSFRDRPPPGRWFYRVAVAANWLDSTEEGDPYWLSGPAALSG